MSAVGVFDSGLGGLSVLRAIRAALPQQDLIYFADTAHTPWGGRDPAFIRARSIAIANRLIQGGAQAIVVACNTATAIAIEALRQQLSLPVVGIEPAVKPAAALTRSGVVGVLATSATVASPRYRALVERSAGKTRVMTRACPGWVEAVEAGEFASPATLALVREQVEPLLSAGADTLVLGCTHFPFLADVIRTVAGPGVTLIEPGAAVARVLRERLAATGALAPEGSVGRLRFLSTAPSTVLDATASRLWGAPLHFAPA